MSNLLEQASLVMIPSGYKEDIVYSVIPTSGAGDLTFTRASNGTRIDSNGNVEVVPWNAIQYSEDFANAVWSIPNGGSSVVVTTNATTAPNGTNTADKIEIANGSFDRIEQVSTAPILTAGLPCTFSCYIKSVSGTGKVGIRSGQSGVSSVLSYTNEWQRLTWTFNSLSTYEIPQFCNNTLVSGADSAPTFYAWGAQLNIGSTAKPYFPTTDRLNVPRLTYQNGGGGCPSLLLEKQSTNLCTYSEGLSNGVYTQSNVSVSANTSVSPDGTSNADTITSSAASPQLISPAVSFASSTNVSLFVKYVSQKYVQLFSGGAFGDYVNFDIESGAVGSNGGTTTNAQIQSFGNGWYRISATFGGYTGTTTGRIGFVDSLSAGWNNLTSTTSKSIYGWGFQIEASSYPTSYIPTTTSSATRVADECSKTGISSLIGQTQGSVFFDFTVASVTQPGDPVLWYMKDGGVGERYVELYSNGNLVYAEIDGSGPIAIITKSGLTVGRHKCAIAYATNDFVFYVDGVQIGTDTSGTPGGFSTFGLQYYLSVYTGQQQVNQCAIFPTRLTNSELAQLTGNQNYTINQAYESYGVASESPNCVQP